MGFRGEKSVGTRFLYVPSPPLGIEPKQIRILPKYNAMHFDIEYIYEIETIPFLTAKPDSFIAIDLGLDNFAACVTTDETAFLIEGCGIKSYNRWWNKLKSKYQSTLNLEGFKTSKRMAKIQQYRTHVIDNYLHVVQNIISYCLDNNIGSIIVGEWGDMKRALKMRKKVGQLFQLIPYRKFKNKLKYKATLHGIDIDFIGEEYTSQDCFGCGLRRKANRIKRGLYRCIKCGMQLNADINAALNIMKKVVPNDVNIEWDSGDIISPSRIRLVDFV